MCVWRVLSTEKSVTDRNLWCNWWYECNRFTLAHLVLHEILNIAKRRNKNRFDTMCIDKAVQENLV